LPNSSYGSISEGFEGERPVNKYVALFLFLFTTFGVLLASNIQSNKAPLQNTSVNSSSTLVPEQSQSRLDAPDSYTLSQDFRTAIMQTNDPGLNHGSASPQRVLVGNQLNTDQPDRVSERVSDEPYDDGGRATNDTVIQWLGDTRWTFTNYQPTLETDIRPLPAVISGLAVAGLFTAQHLAQAQTIWADKSEFKFLEDGNYALYLDKPGHVFSSYYASYFFSDAFLAAGVGFESSMLAGGLMGFGYTLYIEILDGYGANWGFSTTDMIANTLGSGLYIAQAYVPELSSLQLKFSYWPGEWHGERSRQPHDFFVDDYSSQTFYLSLNLHDVLPESARDFWPDWLNVAMGYAARNLCDGADPTLDCSYSTYSMDSDQYGGAVYGQRRFVFALDYDLQRLIPEGPPWINWLVQTANFVKWPAPAVEYSIEEDRFRFFLAYPF
jgi:hypothetical protein